MEIKTTVSTYLDKAELEEALGLFIRDRFSWIPDKIKTDIPLDFRVNALCEKDGDELAKRGYIRKNVGLTKYLVNFLNSKRSEQKQPVSFDDAYKAMQKQFPDLPERTL